MADYRFEPWSQPLKVICLTGGLAAGKSTAVKYLEQQGAKVIDADVLGHRAYDPGTDAFNAVVNTFGDDVKSEDGEIDRRVLGGKVFGQPEKLKQLTDIVWPEIRRLAENEISMSQKSNPEKIVVLEAAVLFEAGWENVGDEVWVVVVDPETAIERAMARDGYPRESVQSRLDSQLSNEERIARADVIITNNAQTEDMIKQLDEAWANTNA
ncbi:MAG: phosphopantetheine adenylyltransferase/dephospho-CoA kinase [Candidatus Azotimanducaceae bacterium]|jgi:phosphopantetheine adenylyltransferase/dephospho-CoA kinase